MRPRIVEWLAAATGTEVFSFAIPDPAFVYALAIAACGWVFVRRVRHDGLSQYHALGAALWGALGGLAGARLFYLVQEYGRLINDPGMLFDLSGATVSWGAYLGGTTAFLLYFRRNNIPSLPYLDVTASCLGLGVFIGRWSCFLNGDDYGTLTTVPWGVSFPHGSYPFAAQVKLGLIDPLGTLSLPVHPVQLYGSLKGLMLFLLFTAIWKRYRSPSGMLFCLYWMAFAIVRFGLEFFRGDQSRGFIGILSAGQIMSVIVCVTATAVVLYFLWVKRARFIARQTAALSHS